VLIPIIEQNVSVYLKAKIEGTLMLQRNVNRVSTVVLLSCIFTFIAVLQLYTYLFKIGYGNNFVICPRTQ